MCQVCACVSLGGGWMVVGYSTTTCIKTENYLFLYTEKKCMLSKLVLISDNACSCVLICFCYSRYLAFIVVYKHIIII